MRTTVPSAFKMSFKGPEGEYEIDFVPIDEWDGKIDVTIAGVAMRWRVVHADQEEGGGYSLGGMTDGTEDFWDHVFWFELRIYDKPPVIRYWGDRVIWREDSSVL
jgi:hypothetical protein